MFQDKTTNDQDGQKGNAKPQNKELFKKKTTAKIIKNYFNFILLLIFNKFENLLRILVTDVFLTNVLNSK